MPTRTVSLPPRRPSRVVVEPVRPIVDGGALPAKATFGEPMHVVADVFTDGHDVAVAAVRWRTVPATGEPGPWQERALEPLGNDRFAAMIVPTELGRLEFDVIGWIDHLETWRRGTAAKAEADLDVTLELASGERLVDAALASTTMPDADRQALTTLRRALHAGDTSELSEPRWPAVFWRTSPRDPIASLPTPLRVDVDPLHGAFGAWYEFFPRSTVTSGTATTGTATTDTTADELRHRTLAESIDRLDHIAALGFDIVYLPPIHPIGTTNRKGRNNSTTAEIGEVGSPWAIGASTGGHTAVHPALGTVDDVANLATACQARGMHLALDIAFQCSPDHPWVSEHPEWFAKRSDGSIQFAENPPKKYEDIYPLDFESDDWQSLWEALADVFRFWIARGVTVFRVDNPHTKAFAFWAWALKTLRAEHPETVFLAESFTRPRVMEQLAKIGFNQNYTYFTWRQASWELREYFTDLSTRTVDYFRPNAWPNTPDILTEQLQSGDRPVFVTRAILAATLSPSWGVYGPAYELLEHLPIREGSEEYLDSEKYQLRSWDLDRDDSLAPLLARLNQIRRDHRAFRNLDTIHFHDTDDPGLLCFTRTDPTGAGLPIIVVVNLDPDDRHSGFVDIDLAAIGLPEGADYDVVDELGGVTYRWSGSRNFVDLAPWSASAHVFSVHRVDDHDPDRTSTTPGVTA